MSRAEAGRSARSMWSRRGRGRWVAAALASAVAAGLFAWAWVATEGFWTGTGVGDEALAGRVAVSSEALKLSADARGTDVTGLLDNGNAVAVDVTLRVVGYDYGEDPFVTVKIGPRRVGAGSAVPFHTLLDVTPLKRIKVDVVKVYASSRP